MIQTTSTHIRSLVPLGGWCSAAEVRCCCCGPGDCGCLPSCHSEKTRLACLAPLADPPDPPGDRKSAKSSWSHACWGSGVTAALGTASVFPTRMPLSRFGLGPPGFYSPFETYLAFSSTS